MSKRKNSRTADPNQLSLLDSKIIEGHLADVPHLVRAELVSAVRRCPLSRYQIAARISELMKSDVSKIMLDKYTSKSADGHRFPAELIPAFCIVTGTLELLKVFAGPTGCSFAGPEETEELEIVRLEELEIFRLRLEKERLERKIKNLTKEAR